MKLVPPARRLRSLPRPRPATAIALVALVMAMGGTSVAGSLISGSTLKNGSVTGKKLAKGTIDGTRLGKGAVTGVALGAGAVSWKSLGAQIVAAAPVALPVGSTKAVPVSATATCPAGTVGISGGEVMSDPSQAFVIQSVQAGMNGAQAGLPGSAPTGWSATGAAAGYNAATMTVYAICIAAG
jgi:trimeric autotransporter adhesin